MEPDQWYINGCVQASAEDEALFHKWTGHLPKREESTPYHSGAHSVKHFRHALLIAGLGDRYQQFSVLEVGFCLGHSAEIFYNLGASFVCSIENSDRAETLQAARAVKMKHNGFMLAMPWEKNVLRGVDFDLGFIDGDHSNEAIRSDVALMKERRVPWVLFDDFWPHWGDTQQVMKELGITPVAILGTMALCDFR